jgi:hypothetical protein
VRPDAGHAALGHLLDFVIRELLPFVDHQRIEPRVVGTHSSRRVEERNRFVEIVQHGRVPIEKRAHHVARERERHRHAVAIVVVRDVFSPINKVRRGLAGIRFAVVVDVDLAIAPVDFARGSDQHHHVLANILNQRRVFDGEAIRQFHQHLGRSGFGRVNRS